MGDWILGALSTMIVVFCIIQLCEVSTSNPLLANPYSESNHDDERYDN